MVKSLVAGLFEHDAMTLAVLGLACGAGPLITKIYEFAIALMNGTMGGIRWGDIMEMTWREVMHLNKLISDYQAETAPTRAGR